MSRSAAQTRCGTYGGARLAVISDKESHDAVHQLASKSGQCRRFGASNFDTIDRCHLMGLLWVKMFLIIITK